MSAARWARDVEPTAPVRTVPREVPDREVPAEVSNAVERVTRWRCTGCGKEYDTRAAAQACASQGRYPARFQPGDVVICRRHGYGWHDGDPAWVAEVSPDAGLHGAPAFTFYYVVGAVTWPDPHGTDRPRPRYHLFTRAMTPDSGHAEGWTVDEGHIPAELVADPPCLPGAEAFLGRRTDTLL